jgi:hypothetical protein
MRPLPADEKAPQRFVVRGRTRSRRGIHQSPIPGPIRAALPGWPHRRHTRGLKAAPLSSPGQPILSSWTQRGTSIRSTVCWPPRAIYCPHPTGTWLILTTPRRLSTFRRGEAVWQVPPQRPHSTTSRQASACGQPMTGPPAPSRTPWSRHMRRPELPKASATAPRSGLRRFCQWRTPQLDCGPSWTRWHLRWPRCRTF